VKDGVLEIEYVGARRSPSDVSVAIDAIFQAAAEDPDTLDGLLPSELKTLREGIKVEQRSAGFDPATVALVVAFAPAACHILTSLWDKFILPRLQFDLGDDAIGRERKRK
jgi:hypothetical protein